MKTILIKRTQFQIFIISLLLVSSCSAPDVDKVVIGPPENLYGKLFYDVQADSNLFSDSKTFVDCIPLEDPSVIRKKYSDLSDRSVAALQNFLKNNFIIPGNESAYITDSASVNEHISRLWDVLKRPPDKVQSGTLIPLPYAYIVPGGRFREIYYWDTYFTMLGLEQNRQYEIIQDMIDNFSYLITQYGYIPNGNRTYYLGRSQPPFYPAMVSLLAEIKGDTVYTHYLKYMEKEYEFWMNGTGNLKESVSAYRRVVRLKDGEILNRYWSDENTPRSESYREDVKTANEAVSKMPGIKWNEVYRNLRATAESGWDFSSRWLSMDSTGTWPLYTIHTTDIVPVDLNSLMYNMEFTLSKAYRLAGDTAKSKYYKSKYESRGKAIIKYCWNTKKGLFMDYNSRTGQQTNVMSLAGMYPLFFRIATTEQAGATAAVIERYFLKPGGVVPTLYNTGQQWDYPNGWAPLEWITITGLQNYNFEDLASVIKERWLYLNTKVYRSTFKMLEKYDVVDTTKKSGGGEYPTQDGFGWTNGVFQKLSGE